MKPPIRRKQEVSWATVLINAGLAAIIAALGSFGTDRAKGVREQRSAQCGIAAAFLQEQKPNAYLDQAIRRRLTQEAVATFERCMAER